MADSKVLVRLKPYNPKRGFKLERVMFRGVKFLQDRWYKVPAKHEPALKDMTQDPNDEDSQKAFDVVRTLAEAQEIVKKEKQRAARKAAKADSPLEVTETSGGDLSINDLPKVTSEASKNRRRSGSNRR